MVTLTLLLHLTVSTFFVTGSATLPNGGFMVLCLMGPAVQRAGPFGKMLGMYAFRNTFLYCFLSGVSFTMLYFFILYKVNYATS